MIRHKIQHQSGDRRIKGSRLARRMSSIILPESNPAILEVLAYQRYKGVRGIEAVNCGRLAICQETGYRSGVGNRFCFWKIQRVMMVSLSSPIRVKRIGYHPE
jgi:hypothetical protein